MLPFTAVKKHITLKGKKTSRTVSANYKEQRFKIPLTSLVIVLYTGHLSKRLSPQ